MKSSCDNSRIVSTLIFVPHTVILTHYFHAMQIRLEQAGDRAEEEKGKGLCDVGRDTHQNYLIFK